MLTSTKRSILLLSILCAGLVGCIFDGRPQPEAQIQTVVMPDRFFCNNMRGVMPITFDTGPRGTRAGEAGYDTAATARGITAANQTFQRLCK